MFRYRTSLPLAFSQPLLAPDDGNPGGGGEGNPPETPPAPPKVEFTPEQQERINALVAAERKSTEERLAADAARKAAGEEEQRQRDEAAKRGEFDKVRTELEGKVSATESERDALKGENEALSTYFATQYQAALKELPDVITAFAPAEDASFAEKSGWLTKAQAQAAKMPAEGSPGHRPNPNPSDGKFDQDAAIARAKSSGRYNV